MKHSIFLLIALLIAGNVFSQCPSGAMGVSGAGCGCLGGCNLSTFGGPNCSPAVSGNCLAGFVTMTPVDIVVPPGCTYTVVATMALRPGCASSGADGNCQTCDVLKVDIPGGPKIFQQGASNATLTDNYVLLGPGTIRISGIANRADEIITYTVTSSGCVNCSPLPVELLAFNAIPTQTTIELSWATNSESNNDYFTIERSPDGVYFEDYAFMDGQGNSDSPFRYNLVDASPLEGISFYRLKQTDFDGSIKYFATKTVLFKPALAITIFPNPADQEFALGGKHLQDAQIQLVDAFGREIELTSQMQDGLLHFDASQLAEGVYFLQVAYDGNRETKQLMISR